MDSKVSVLPRQFVAFNRLQKARFLFAICILALCIFSKFSKFSLNLPYLLLIQVALFLVVFVGVLNYLKSQEILLLSLIKWGLLLDIFVLTEFLLFTGGSSNPLTFLYLFPILTASLLCPPRFAWGLLLISVSSYLLLFFLHYPFPIIVEDPQYLFNIHLSGMWLTFALSAVLITLWVSGLADAIRQQERHLSHAHKRQQEEEYWLSLGMEAANVAHRLSTPLNNMILISEEICQNPELTESIRIDIKLLDRQLQECKDSLCQLKEYKPSNEHEIQLYETLSTHLEQWHNLRPDARCQWHRHSQDSLEYKVILDDCFWLALMNILNNAADAGDGLIDLYSRMYPKGLWEIGIHNRSGYLSEAQLERAGLDVLESDKPSGLGLGVRLSHATLSRLSGSLTLSNHPQGGVYARITIPVTIQGADNGTIFIN